MPRPITEDPADELYADELWHGDDVPELPTAEDEEQAQRYLRAFAYYERERDRVTALFETEIERLTNRMHVEEAKLERRLEFLTASLKRFYEASGAKRVVLAHGTLSQRQQPERVVFEDEAAFVATAPEKFVVRVTNPDRNAIKQHIKETGELPEGVDLVRNEPKFTIALAE